MSLVERLWSTPPAAGHTAAGDLNGTVSGCDYV